MQAVIIDRSYYQYPPNVRTANMPCRLKNGVCVVRYVAKFGNGEQHNLIQIPFYSKYQLNKCDARAIEVFHEKFGKGDTDVTISAAA